mmetsp:Transcript_7249/g.14815  ORF Transcript_7249/g.14815 Transcript_7249/m.14815 type:complete len:169 (-) Transcript_7249:1617-2123(-)
MHMGPRPIQGRDITSPVTAHSSMRSPTTALAQKRRIEGPWSLEIGCLPLHGCQSRNTTSLPHLTVAVYKLVQAPPATAACCQPPGNIIPATLLEEGDVGADASEKGAEGQQQAAYPRSPDLSGPRLAGGAVDERREDINNRGAEQSARDANRHRDVREREGQGGGGGN